MNHPNAPWFQPIRKMWVKLDHVPIYGVKIFVLNHHPDTLSIHQPHWLKQRVLTQCLSNGNRKTMNLSAINSGATVAFSGVMKNENQAKQWTTFRTNPSKFTINFHCLIIWSPSKNELFNDPCFCFGRKKFGKKPRYTICPKRSG